MRLSMVTFATGRLVDRRFVVRILGQTPCASARRGYALYKDIVSWLPRLMDWLAMRTAGCPHRPREQIIIETDHRKMLLHTQGNHLAVNFRSPAPLAQVKRTCLGCIAFASLHRS